MGEGDDKSLILQANIGEEAWAATEHLMEKKLVLQSSLPVWFAVGLELELDALKSDVTEP